MLLVTSLTAVLLGAVSDPPAATSDVDAWPSFRGDPALTGVSQSALGLPLELAWTAATEKAITSTPAIADGRVYVGSDDQHLHCFDAKNGELLWKFPTEDMIEAPPLVHGGMVFVGSSDGFLYALDAETGEEQWRFQTLDRILGGVNWVPAAEGDGFWVVFGSYDAHVYCLDAASGEEQWRYSTDNYINGTPATDGKRIIFGGCDTFLHVVSAVDGTAMQQIELGEGCHVAGSVAIADDRVYFGHYGEQFLCVDLNTEELVWAYEGRRGAAFFSSPAIGDKVTIIGARDRKLHCVNKADGTGAWTFASRKKIDSSPVLCGDRVVLASGDGNLYVLDLASGDEVWSYDIGQAIYSSPAVASGLIVVGCEDGKLYAFRGKAKPQAGGDE